MPLPLRDKTDTTTSRPLRPALSLRPASLSPLSEGERYSLANHTRNYTRPVFDQSVFCRSVAKIRRYISDTQSDKWAFRCSFSLSGVRSSVTVSLCVVIPPRRSPTNQPFFPEGTRSDTPCRMRTPDIALVVYGGRILYFARAASGRLGSR